MEDNGSSLVGAVVGIARIGGGAISAARGSLSAAAGATEGPPVGGIAADGPPGGAAAILNPPTGPGPDGIVGGGFKAGLLVASFSYKQIQT